MNQVALDCDGGISKDLLLVVEDEILIRMNLSDELRRAGFDVVEASDAEEARRVLTCISGVKAILTDIRMPGAMDGIGLARWVRREFPEIEIAVLSGDVDMLQPQDADIAFNKPAQMLEVVRGLRLLLAKNEHSGP